MMKWPHTLIAGSALILLTNAVVLLGAAYNHSTDPDSMLQLSQRELQHDRWNKKDNSGITLRLNWRVASAQQNELGMGYTGRWGSPAWLDKNKMAELGFDVAKLATKSENDRRYKSTQSREVMLVMELNDQAYRDELKRVKEFTEQARVLQAGNPNRDEFKQRAKNAAESYQRELHDNSRLFVIDAGIDLLKLRAAYPDRTRYAIVHGLIRPNVVFGQDGRIGGTISKLHAEHINVPFNYRQVFEAAAPYEVTVAFGKRLEPWITAASGSLAAK